LAALYRLTAWVELAGEARFERGETVLRRSGATSATPPATTPVPAPTDTGGTGAGQAAGSAGGANVGELRVIHHCREQGWLADRQER
jgi:hypothetical protein